MPQLWRNDGPTEYGLEVFTYGECWTLAYYLHREGGWPIYTLAPGAMPEWWEHVVVRIGFNAYLDVLGVRTLAQVRATFGPTHEYVCTRFMRPFTTWDEYVQVMGGDHLHERPRERARVMAKRLVKKYVHDD